MTEQELKAQLDQLKLVNMFEMIPGYKEMSNDMKKSLVEMFQMSIDKEKAKLANEQ
jgi:hypothetical protein